MGIVPLFCHDSSVAPSTSDQLPSLSYLQLYIMDEGAQGYILQGEGVPGLDIHIFSRPDLIPDLEVEGGKDISLFTIGIV